MDLLKVRDVAASLNISKVAVREWIRKGRLPYLRFGRMFLLKEVDVEKFVEEHYHQGENSNRNPEPQ